jgi:hypothetical protein
MANLLISSFPSYEVVNDIINTINGTNVPLTKTRITEIDSTNSYLEILHIVNDSKHTTFDETETDVLKFYFKDSQDTIDYIKLLLI